MFDATRQSNRPSSPLVKWHGHPAHESRGHIAPAGRSNCRKFQGRDAHATFSRRGFTLAELMISLGIMAIGLALISALFPAAIRQSANTINDTLGMQICHNGLSIVKARLGTSQLNNSIPATLTEITSLLSPLDIQYPINFASAGQEIRGFKLLGRQLAPNVNDYQFVVIAYGKAQAANTVNVVPVAGLVFSGSLGRTVQSPGYTLPVGTPVIDPATGLFATVQGATKTDAGAPAYMLDHAFSNGAGGFVNVTSAYIVTETDPSSNPPNQQLPRSPMMTVLVGRTAVRNN